MSTPVPSKARRDDVINALRRGTVPARGLDLLAVGLDRIGPTIDEEIAQAAAGNGVFKCIRGEWGSGKTFASRWIADRARRAGFVTSEIQISETETPLHHLQTVYRRLVERLSTGDGDTGAFRALIDGWFYVLEEDVLADGTVDEADGAGADHTAGAAHADQGTALQGLDRVAEDLGVAEAELVAHRDDRLLPGDRKSVV